MSILPYRDFAGYWNMILESHLEHLHIQKHDCTIFFYLLTYIYHFIVPVDEANTFSLIYSHSKLLFGPNELMQATNRSHFIAHIAHSQIHSVSQ